MIPAEIIDGFGFAGGVHQPGNHDIPKQPLRDCVKPDMVEYLAEDKFRPNGTDVAVLDVSDKIEDSGVALLFLGKKLILFALMVNE